MFSFLIFLKNIKVTADKKTIKNDKNSILLDKKITPKERIKIKIER